MLLTYCNLHSVSAFDHFDQVVCILDSVGNPLRIEDSEALPLNETRSMTFLRREKVITSSMIKGRTGQHQYRRREELY